MWGNEIQPPVYHLNTSSSLLAPQPYVSLRLLRSFVTANFSGVGSLATRPTPNMEHKGLHFVWPIPYDLSSMGGSTRYIRSLQHNSLGYLGSEVSMIRW
jgi:hypothetical protein